MKTSDAGIALIKRYEGLRLESYRCPAGVLTIGYGHASGGPVVREGMTITQQQANDILQADLAHYEQGVSSLVKVPLAQNQFDALVSFAYNVGLGALGKSTLLKRVNAGRFDEVPAELMKWTKGGGRELPGLVRRRREEAKLWRGIDSTEPVATTESRATPDAPAPKKSIVQSKEANGALAAGAGSAIAAAQEIIPVIKEGGELLSSINVTVIICLSIILIAAAIWYWRKQRLDEEGA